MLEIPESHTVAKQLNAVVRGKSIEKAVANGSPHKFAFFSGEPADYGPRLRQKTLGEARALGGLIEMDAGGLKLLWGDGANLRLLSAATAPPQKHQLCITFTDGASLVCTIQMYGGIWLYAEGENDNPYYIAARDKPSPLSAAFDEAHFHSLLEAAKPHLSAKAFLATEQRIPGLGNGVLQEILFYAGVHPQRKLGQLGVEKRQALFRAVKEILGRMAEAGGRDTEKNLFGQWGGYATRFSHRNHPGPCPGCGIAIQKKA